jgi:eukaryotic-like serine/threonine-protein kinase
VIGRTVKQYVVEAPLGKGGMGVVYRARDTRLDRAVALKFLSEEATLDPDRKRRFLLEARAAGAVNHPAIAQIYDVDEDAGATFIAMELVEGKTVRTLVKNRELDALGAVEIGLQVASGLAKAHEAGIVHRDIKAENIMVTPDGHAKILDFGLAKLLDPLRGDSDTGSPDDVSRMETLAKTQAGMVMGTLRYMSPEQARGLAVDQRSDIFSLGVVLYEMLTSQLPFSGKSAIDTLHAIAFEETRPITALRANLPPSLQRVITRCLRKRPEDRYPDARALEADLKSVQKELESGISTAVPLHVRFAEQVQSLTSLAGSSRLWLALMALLVASLLVVRGRDFLGPLPLVAVGGLIIYRRVRNRRSRFLREFAGKVRKMAEVRIVACHGTQATVVADRAAAKTYVHANAVMDRINRRMFFGDPFTVVVRDGLPAEEEKSLLSGPGILYVRSDVLEGKA